MLCLHTSINTRTMLCVHTLCTHSIVPVFIDFKLMTEATCFDEQKYMNILPPDIDSAPH